MNHAFGNGAVNGAESGADGFRGIGVAVQAGQSLFEGVLYAGVDAAVVFAAALLHQDHLLRGFNFLFCGFGHYRRTSIKLRADYSIA